MAKGLAQRSGTRAVGEKHRGRSQAVALGLALFSVAAGGPPALAQFPPCPPPAANEFLLLVRSNTEAERSRVQNLLPSNSTVMVCDYLNDTVVRAGGFTNLENANAWARYMTEVEGLQAFVARPATIATQPTPPAAGTPTTAPPSQPAVTPPVQPVQTAFAPQPLGSGFAVLHDYQLQPETAIAIQQQIGQAVGLAVYRQRAYLLIAHSPDVEGAASTLAVLSSLGIPGFIVDSQETVMLTPAVALSGQ